MTVSRSTGATPSPPTLGRGDCRCNVCQDMTEPQPTGHESPEAGQRRLSLAAYVGVSVGLLAVAFVLYVAGTVGEQNAQLWNPLILPAFAMGFVYAEPRPPLWQVGAAGAVLGLAYAALVVGAGALSRADLHLSPAEAFLQAVVIGVASALVVELVLRWFARRAASPRRR
jgi:hypothetical protein